MIKELGFWLLVGSGVAAATAVTIWVEHVHQKERRELKDLLEQQKS